METDPRRRDTSTGPPLRILSLDGGGVRGYSIFIIIQEIMHRTFVEIEGRAPKQHEIPKPCEHFDLIMGTGTGGLIALMLGRLRLNIEECKRLYVRLTRLVFETDKTFVGIPLHSTLFKASLLEQAIQEAVREHTVDPDEGNDGTGETVNPFAAGSRHSIAGSIGPRRQPSNASVVSFSARSPTSQMARPSSRARYGNPHAKLYDARENRTKTAVTAMYKGEPKGGGPVILRSYDSRKEPAPEYECKIWEAGRATSAVGMAFKPVTIGQSVFHDDGGGTFNPAPSALDEAVVNEWPGREVGVFISVGTGKRPKSSGANQHLWYDGFLGDFAEARKKLIAKIEGCETIHEYMKREHLAKRGVNIENYYRLNVEIGVGEFGMNEWNRLSEISTGTRRYLSRTVEQHMVQESALKLAKIYQTKQFRERMGNVPDIISSPPVSSFGSPLAVELPGDIPQFPFHHTPPSRQSYESAAERLSLPVASTPSPRTSGDRIAPPTNSASPPPPAAGRPMQYKPPPNDDTLLVTAPTPAQYRTAAGSDKIAITSADEQPRRPQKEQTMVQAQPLQSKPHRIEPPPLPPKTPLPENQLANSRRPGAPGIASPPYPIDDDQPPPAVNMARKPDFRKR